VTEFQDAILEYLDMENEYRTVRQIADGVGQSYVATLRACWDLYHHECEPHKVSKSWIRGRECYRSLKPG